MSRAGITGSSGNSNRNPQRLFFYGHTSLDGEHKVLGTGLPAGCRKNERQCATSSPPRVAKYLMKKRLAGGCHSGWPYTFYGQALPGSERFQRECWKQPQLFLLRIGSVGVYKPLFLKETQARFWLRLKCLCFKKKTGGKKNFDRL